MFRVRRGSTSERGSLINAGKVTPVVAFFKERKGQLSYKKIHILMAFMT